MGKFVWKMHPPCPRHPPNICSAEMTEDGFIEITLELGGRVVATEVTDGSMESWRFIFDTFRDEIRRRC